MIDSHIFMINTDEKENRKNKKSAEKEGKKNKKMKKNSRIRSRYRPLS